VAPLSAVPMRSARPPTSIAAAGIRSPSRLVQAPAGTAIGEQRLDLHREAT